MKHNTKVCASFLVVFLINTAQITAQDCGFSTSSDHQLFLDGLLKENTTCGVDETAILDNSTTYQFGIKFNRYRHDNGNVIPASFLSQTVNGQTLIDLINGAFVDADISFVLAGDSEISFPSSQIISTPQVGQAGYFLLADYLDVYTCADNFYVTILPDNITSTGSAGTANGQALSVTNDLWVKPDINDFEDFVEVLIHELGHNFGLLHTHEGYNGSEPENILRSEPCCNCLQTGDRICDTPADPGAIYNSGGTIDLVGRRVVDDCGETYPDPPPTTLVSNFMAYGDQRDNFVNGQRALMKSVVPEIIGKGEVLEWSANTTLPVIENLVVPEGTSLTIDDDRIFSGRIEVAGSLILLDCNIQIATDSYIALTEGGDLEITGSVIEHYNGPLSCTSNSIGTHWDGIQFESTDAGSSRVDIAKSTVNDARILFSTHEITSNFSRNTAGAPLGNRPSRIRVTDGSILNNHQRVAYFDNGRNNSLRLRDTEVTFDGLSSPGNPVDGYIYATESLVDLQGVDVTKTQPKASFNFVILNNMSRLLVDAQSGKRSIFDGLETVFRISGAIGVEVFNSDFTDCNTMLDVNSTLYVDIRNNSFHQKNDLDAVIKIGGVPVYDVVNNSIFGPASEASQFDAIYMTGRSSESQAHDNQISGNVFNGFDLGTHGTQQVGDEIRGLQMYCNDYDNCDQYNIDIQGRMKLLHGSKDDPAGNLFSTVTTSDGQIRYITTGPQLDYWWAPGERPDQVSSSVERQSTNATSNCGLIGHDQALTYLPPKVPSTQVPTTISTPQVPDGGPFYDPGNGLIGGPNDPSDPDATNPPGNDDCATGPNAPNDPTNPDDPTNPLYGDYNLEIDADYVDGYNVVRNNYWTFMDGGTTLTYVDSIYNYSSSEGRTAILSKAHTLDNQLSPRAAIALIERIEYYCLTEIISIIMKSPVALQNPVVEGFILANCPTCVLPSDISDDCLYKEGRKHAWLSTKREEYLRAKLHGLLRNDIVDVPAVSAIADHFSGITAISYILNAYKTNEDYAGAVSFLDNDAEDLIRYHYSPPIIEYIDVERHVLGIRESGRTLQEMTESELNILISYGYLPEYAGAVARSYVSTVLDYEFGDAAFATRDYTVTGGPCPYSSNASLDSGKLEVLPSIYLPEKYQDLAVSTDLKVEVFDLMGALVSIDISNVPTGVYIIRCSSKSLQQVYSMKQFVLNE